MRDPETGLASALYEGTIGHRRHEPVDHAFTYRILLAYLDLEELPGALDAHRLWSVRRWAPVRFRRDDMHGDPAVPLDAAVRDTVAGHTGQRPQGPIRVLTQLRAWGWAFNPISLYFCFDPDGVTVRTVLADVSNTPWHERHPYVLEVGAGPPGVRFAKELHVSPFMDMNLDHTLSFSPPGGEQFSVRMEDRPRRTGAIAENEAGADDRLIFEADLALTRRPLDRHTMTRVMVRHPLSAHRTTWGIHRQALALWRRGAPFRRHPEHHPERHPHPPPDRTVSEGPAATTDPPADPGGATEATRRPR